MEATLSRPIDFEALLDFRISKSLDTQKGDFILEGFAATSDLDLQGDIITPAAIKASAKDLEKNSTVLDNHDPNKRVGVVLKSEARPGGLWIQVRISETVPLIRKQIQEGVLNKFSIKGQVLEAEPKYDQETGKRVLVILKMYLTHVATVSVPANTEAQSLRWYIVKALELSPEVQAMEKQVPITAIPALPQGTSIHMVMFDKKQFGTREDVVQWLQHHNLRDRSNLIHDAGDNWNAELFPEVECAGKPQMVNVSGAARVVACQRKSEKAQGGETMPEEKKIDVVKDVKPGEEPQIEKTTPVETAVTAKPEVEKAKETPTETPVVAEKAVVAAVVPEASELAQEDLILKAELTAEGVNKVAVLLDQILASLADKVKVTGLIQQIKAMLGRIAGANAAYPLPRAVEASAPGTEKSKETAPEVKPDPVPSELEKTLGSVVETVGKLAEVMGEMQKMMPGSSMRKAHIDTGAKKPETPASKGPTDIMTEMQSAVGDLIEGR